MVWIAFNKDEANAIQELHALSDRAAAIVAAVLLENRIESCLKSVLRDRKKDPVNSLHNEIFQPSGILGSFSAKINLAYMLGIFSAEAWADINQIKDIRNRFAHNLEISNFSSDSIASRCRNLSHFQKFVFEMGTHQEKIPPGLSAIQFQKDLQHDLDDPRRRYLLAVQIYTGSLFVARDANTGPSLCTPLI